MTSNLKVSLFKDHPGKRIADIANIDTVGIDISDIATADIDTKRI